MNHENAGWFNGLQTKNINNHWLKGYLFRLFQIQQCSSKIQKLC